MNIIKHLVLLLYGGLYNNLDIFQGEFIDESLAYANFTHLSIFLNQYINFSAVYNSSRWENPGPANIALRLPYPNVNIRVQKTNSAIKKDRIDVTI